MGAPEHLNPYRDGAARGQRIHGEFADAMMAAAPPRQGHFPLDEESGPGLMAVDLDVIARSHHRLGYRERDRAAHVEIRDLHNEYGPRLVAAFDEGFDAAVPELMAPYLDRLRPIVDGLLAAVTCDVLRTKRPSAEAEALDRAQEVAIELQSELEGIFGPGDRMAEELERRVQAVRDAVGAAR